MIRVTLTTADGRTQECFLEVPDPATPAAFRKLRNKVQWRLDRFARVTRNPVTGAVTREPSTPGTPEHREPAAARSD